MRYYDFQICSSTNICILSYNLGFRYHKTTFKDQNDHLYFAQDLLGVIKKIATFFGKSYSEEEFAKLEKHLNIDNFRKNPMVNEASPNNRMKPELFIRQGKTGGWKEVFTPEIDEKFNKWIADNLKNTDLAFPS